MPLAPAALVSIHDVMPRTLARVESMLVHMETSGIAPVTLLVVPGGVWKDEEVARLHAWSQRGHELAAHGWTHRAESVRGWRHRLHAIALSRGVAEHLALDTRAILRRMVRASRWFVEHGLASPYLYVPPAWALGALDAADRARVPYAAIEVLQGLIDPVGGELRRLPLVGFEADSRARALLLRMWNRRQMRWALGNGRPLRIALHPNDFELRLAQDIFALVARSWRPIAYHEVCARDGRARRSRRWTP